MYGIFLSFVLVKAVLYVFTFFHFIFMGVSHECFLVPHKDHGPPLPEGTPLRQKAPQVSCLPLPEWHTICGIIQGFF